MIKSSEPDKSMKEIKSKKDMVVLGLSLLFGGGFLTLFVITAIIGIPLMILGIFLLILSPFWKPDSRWFKPIWSKK